MLMQIYLPGLAIIAGFGILVWGADRFVFGAAATARNLNVPPMIIGLTIIGFGTSAPEMLVSAVAALNGNPNLAVGNALGSNITNIALVLGITAITVPLAVSSETLKREYPIMFLVMLFTLSLIYDLKITRLDGIILLTGLIIIMVWLVRIGMRQKSSDPMENEFEHEIPTAPFKTGLIWLGAGLALLLVSSKILVWGAVEIAHFFKLSDLVIGLTIVALGTSLPELATSIMSALKKEHDLAIGNVIGSIMFNLLAVIGISAVITPISLESVVITRDYTMMLGLTIALFVMAYGFRGNGRINRIEGMILLAGYFGYMGWLYVTVHT